MKMKLAYLIICGTVTLELSSKAFIISPLHRMLSMHCRTDAVEENSEDRGNVGELWHADFPPTCSASRLAVEDCDVCWRAWLMSLVHADFSCLEEATRMTVNDWLSFGSTTILKSRCSMSWPLLSDLAFRWTQRHNISCHFLFRCALKTEKRIHINTKEKRTTIEICIYQIVLCHMIWSSIFLLLAKINDEILMTSGTV